MGLPRGLDAMPLAVLTGKTTFTLLSTQGVVCNFFCFIVRFYICTFIVCKK
jgi:hypothetical protein